MVSVFIVEDELAITQLYEMLLSAYGFDVIGTAKNGEEAVEMYEKFSVKPDIIIMDHRMPIKNGIEASKEILQINKNAKIIFATADTTVKEIANSIGVVSFITKPFDNQKLLRNIKKALEKEDHRITKHN